LGGGLRGAGQSERGNVGNSDYPVRELNLDLLTRSLVTLLAELFVKMYLLNLQKIFALLFLYHQFEE
jgi:hypothetical protein